MTTRQRLATMARLVERIDAQPDRINADVARSIVNAELHKLEEEQAREDVKCTA